MQRGLLAARVGQLTPLALLVACALLPPSAVSPSPLTIPAAWSAADAAGAGAAAVTEASLAGWWRRFDDAQLEFLVRGGLHANTSIQGAMAALGQALREVAAASLWPALDGSASVQRGTAGGRSTGNNFHLGLNTKWVIDLFGARRAAVDAGQASVAASQASLGDVQVQIAAEVALDYILLRAVLGSLLASATLPVFDGGALRAQVRVQQAALAQAQQGCRAVVLLALQQVEDALVALRGDRLRLASLRLAADAASNAASLARQRYRSGLIDFQTVLQTQRTQFATQDGMASASADASSDHVRLFKALGGGWSSATPRSSGGGSPTADAQLDECTSAPRRAEPACGVSQCPCARCARSPICGCSCDRSQGAAG